MSSRRGLHSDCSTDLLRSMSDLESGKRHSLPRLLVASRQFLGDCGIGSRMPIQNDRNSRNKLVQEVEVGDIPCQYAGTNTPRLKIDERIVEVFPLMTRTLRRAAETNELARKHSRFAPHRRVRSLQAMPRN